MHTVSRLIRVKDENVPCSAPDAFGFAPVSGNSTSGLALEPLIVSEFVKLCGTQAFLAHLTTLSVTILIKFPGKTDSHFM